METPYSFSHIVIAHYKRQAFAQVCAPIGLHPRPAFSLHHHLVPLTNVSHQHPNTHQHRS
jgi:hypothetical protein